MSRSERKVVTYFNVLNANGPYSSAVRVDSTVYVSGCLGLDPVTGDLVSTEVKGQMEQALNNLQIILNAAGSSLSKGFKEPFPARLCAQVAQLPLGAKVEIEAVAISGIVCKL